MTGEAKRDKGLPEDGHERDGEFQQRGEGQRPNAV